MMMTMKSGRRFKHHYLSSCAPLSPQKKETTTTLSSPSLSLSRLMLEKTKGGQKPIALLLLLLFTL